MRVIYLGISNDRVRIISYSGEEATKAKFKPLLHTVTTTGFHIAKEYKRKNFLNIDTFKLKSYEFDKLKLLEDLNLMIEKTTNIISLDNKLQPLINYIRYGEMVDGLMDNSFTPEELEVLDRIKKQFKQSTITVTTYDWLNEDHIVEYFANMLESRYWDNEYTGKEFFGTIPFKHPFISGKYIVIDKTKFKVGEQYTFSIVSYPTSKEIGRPLPNTKEVIVKVNELPEYYLSIIDIMIKTLGNDDRIFVLPLDKLNNRIIIRDIIDSLHTFKVSDKEHQKVIMSSGGEAIAYTVFPPALSRIVKDNRDFNTGEFKYVDISNKLYIEDKIDPAIPQAGHILTVVNDDINFKVLLDYDLPSRNVLKRLEKSIVSIELGYKPTKDIIRYNVKVKLNNGEEAIYYSPFSSYTLKGKI